MTLPLVLQAASSGLLLAFGVQARRVWRHFGPVRRERVALGWAVTAAAFLLVGTYATAHALLSVAAVIAGRGSWLWEFTVLWAPAFNAGRCVIMVAFAGLLLALLVVGRRYGHRIAQAAPAVLVVGAIAGTTAGGLFPDNTPYGFLTMMAVLNAATAVVLMGALLAAVQNDGLDQLLWLALAVYALKEIVSVSLLSVMAWWGLIDVGTYTAIYRWLQVVLGVIMVAFGARRLQLATGGRRVPALFEQLPALRPPVHG